MQISLKAARINANLSQIQLAELLGVSDSTISRWEKGQTDMPKGLLSEFCKQCHIKEESIIDNGKD